MSEQENGTGGLHSEQPKPGQTGLNMQINPQGIVLSFPVNLGIDNETMAQLVKAYLVQHPELAQEIASASLAQKQQEQHFLRLVKESRNE